MFIQNNIIAGRILSLLEQEDRAMTVNELAYYLEEEGAFVEAGVKRLVQDQLAVLDAEHGLVKVERVPEFIFREPAQTSMPDRSLVMA